MSDEGMHPIEALERITEIAGVQAEKSSSTAEAFRLAFEKGDADEVQRCLDTIICVLGSNIAEAHANAQKSVRFDYDLTWICRAVGDEGAVELKLIQARPMDDDAIPGVERAVEAKYTQSFGAPPKRVGMAVLPYSPDEDDENPNEKIERLCALIREKLLPAIPDEGLCADVDQALRALDNVGETGDWRALFDSLRGGGR